MSQQIWSIIITKIKENHLLFLYLSYIRYQLYILHLKYLTVFFSVVLVWEKKILLYIWRPWAYNFKKKDLKQALKETEKRVWTLYHFIALMVMSQQIWSTITRKIKANHLIFLNIIIIFFKKKTLRNSIPYN